MVDIRFSAGDKTLPRVSGAIQRNVTRCPSARLEVSKAGEDLPEPESRSRQSVCHGDDEVNIFELWVRALNFDLIHSPFPVETRMRTLFGRTNGRKRLNYDTKFSLFEYTVLEYIFS